MIKQTKRISYNAMKSCRSLNDWEEKKKKVDDEEPNDKSVGQLPHKETKRLVSDD